MSSWLQKLLPPRIKRDSGVPKKAVPEGLWSKCDSCEAVLYRTDLEKNLFVCPKCSHHNRVSARAVSTVAKALTRSASSASRLPIRTRSL